ncbi:MAG: FecR domain-containing protein [Prolixibacteraceae bacterium]|jgi:hypothetical protein|nr:FecR domain-containing protein [Prolixibacteraceae bacterium]
MNLNRFNSYSAEDFVIDEIFCEIVGGGTPAVQNLKEQFPFKKHEIDLAVEMLNKLQSLEFQQSPEKKLEQWDQILKNKRKSIRFTIFRIAAAVLLIIGSTAIAYYQLSRHSIINQLASTKEVNYANARLILVDGEQIDIGQNRPNIKYSADGAGVLVNDSTEKRQSVNTDGFNQVIVPFGQHTYLILSDGTKVWINSGSRLVYSPVFKGKSREVFLEGEAYFEVTKDENKPFYVGTNAFRVKVYGTKFDVQAYKQNNEYNTILMEGKVSLEANKGGIMAKEQFLYPDQKATLSDNKKDFLVSEVANIENYTAWKDGYLLFKNEAFQSILKRVSHYYNVDIELNDEIQVRRLSGKLDLKEDPERVLEGLALISKIRFVKTNNKYRFYE